MRVRAQEDGTDPADEFARVFPDFVWVVRDFRLQEGERPISADEYLDQILRPQICKAATVHPHLAPCVPKGSALC